ncbi:hypothetical protein [Actinomadura mexicana]|uniref:hypothetical protein n=1 Tax=Actinomadura mexicana TaxID=134959 RepID=UPI00117862D1|nr:hypothetical protein [Actinomadura mexicana]
MSILHEEFDVKVVNNRPWGVEVEFPDGTHGLVDNLKNPEWLAGDSGPNVGKVIRVAVIDDMRSPIRVSALAEDIAIARRIRDSTSDY